MELFKEATSVILLTPPNIIMEAIITTIILGIQGEILKSPVTEAVIELFCNIAIHIPTAITVVTEYAIARGLLLIPFSI